MRHRAVYGSHPAHPAQMSFGVLTIKQRQKCSDDWVGKQVRENLYHQYFTGMKKYSNEYLLDVSTIMASRKRFSPEEIAWI